MRHSFLVLSFLLFGCIVCQAFWVVNFGTARTIPRRKFGFAAGMGGQMVFLGTPRKTSAFFTIPHAGFRYGLTEKLDAGLRLAPIPLPFSTVGPGFGVNLDVKYWLTKPEGKIDFAIDAGFGGAHVLIEEQHRYAYSPNAAFMLTLNSNEKTHWTLLGRYVQLNIPTAQGGNRDNHVRIIGSSIGLKKDIRTNISILPEVGFYYYDGKVLGVRKNGPGWQYGLMISCTL
jgi:hypothetical protein